MLEIVFTYSVRLHMNKTFNGVLPFSILCLFSTYSFIVDINSKSLNIHASSLLNNTQYFCKWTLFPYVLIELHLYYLELFFGTLRRDCKGNNPFPLNTVMVMWRHFIDNYIGGIDGMNNIRSVR